MNLIIKSLLKVVDNSGIMTAELIKVLGNGKKKANLGDRVVLVVKSYSNKWGVIRRNIKKRKRFGKGSIHKGMIIRTKKIYRRSNGVWISFLDNAVILTGKKNRPLAKKVKGPVLLELVLKNPGLTFMCEDLL